MEVKEVLFMNKGEGENSYVQNSKFTQIVASKSKPSLEGAVQSLFSENFGNFHLKRALNVADLGCSSGPNTFDVMSTVVESVEKTCREFEIQIPEIQFYLNDLHGNDFNTLFKGLTSFSVDSEAVPFFDMGAPGSFHGRLFPRKSMDLVYSSYSLHWLSQVPKLINEEGLALNKGTMYVSTLSPPIVRELYAAQFQNDVTSFLKARSEEMASHGRLVLVIVGEDSTSNIPTSECYTWKPVNDAITRMISQGLIDEEKLDSFNVPFYASSTDEIQNLIDSEGSFVIEYMKTFIVDGKKAWIGESDIAAPRKVAEIAAKNFRCFTESMVSHHFGEEIMDELYGKFVEDVLFDDMSEGPIMFSNIVVVLKRINV